MKIDEEIELLKKKAQFNKNKGIGILIPGSILLLTGIILTVVINFALFGGGLNSFSNDETFIVVFLLYIFLLMFGSILYLPFIFSGLPLTIIGIVRLSKVPKYNEKIKELEAKKASAIEEEPEQEKENKIETVQKVLDPEEELAKARKYAFENLIPGIILVSLGIIFIVLRFVSEQINFETITNNVDAFIVSTLELLSSPINSIFLTILFLSIGIPFLIKGIVLSCRYENKKQILEIKENDGEI
ncbi:MAG: hypothetical protein MJ217_00390 [Bacilli bacterium]|nr:hypothetical protein [Bacilli bacterium]